MKKDGVEYWCGIVWLWITADDVKDEADLFLECNFNVEKTLIMGEYTSPYYLTIIALEQLVNDSWQL